MHEPTLAEKRARANSLAAALKPFIGQPVTEEVKARIVERILEWERTEGKR